MKVYILKEEDFELLHSKLNESTRGTALANTEEKRIIYEDIYRRFNYVIREWEDKVKK